MLYTYTIHDTKKCGLGKFDKNLRKVKCKVTYNYDTSFYKTHKEEKDQKEVHQNANFPYL